MTNAEFFERYKQQRVRVNNNASSRRHRGKEGVVRHLRSIYQDEADKDGIGVILEDGGMIWFEPRKLDVIEEIDRKPLPLPG